MESVLIGVLFGGIGGAVLGYWLATHIHAVATSAASATQRATTIHTGIAPLDSGFAKIGQAVGSEIAKVSP